MLNSISLNGKEPPGHSFFLSGSIEVKVKQVWNDMRQRKTMTELTFLRESCILDCYSPERLVFKNAKRLIFICHFWRLNVDKIVLFLSLCSGLVCFLLRSSLQCFLPSERNDPPQWFIFLAVESERVAPHIPPDGPFFSSGPHAGRLMELAASVWAGLTYSQLPESSPRSHVITANERWQHRCRSHITAAPLNSQQPTLLFLLSLSLCF